MGAVPQKLAEAPLLQSTWLLAVGLVRLAVLLAFGQKRCNVTIT